MAGVDNHFIGQQEKFLVYASQQRIHVSSREIRSSDGVIEQHIPGNQ